MDESIDWSIFNREYPVEDGIVMTLPKELDYDVQPDLSAKHFFDVHSQVIQKYKGQNLMHDKDAMARLQKDFYDKMAVAFQAMDDNDIKNGGIFWWKLHRTVQYDARFFRKGRLLFIGAGNCRLARMFAQMGYDVVATDISKNMLKIGKEISDAQGIRMTYVVHNAEKPFPFKDGVFDSSYSLCVINHIVDWHHYIREKMRCLRNNGVLLERMPNIDNPLWQNQGMRDGVEMRADVCNPDSALRLLQDVGINGRVWTHDRQLWLEKRVPKMSRNNGLRIMKLLYRVRTFYEDRVLRPQSRFDDGIGIYTMIRARKL